MRSAIVTFSVTETGSVKRAMIVDESTHETFVPLTVWDAPYLGSFETGEDWRRALGTYANNLVKAECSIDYVHGESLVYVSPQCSTYVYQVDFDEQQK